MCPPTHDAIDARHLRAMVPARPAAAIALVGVLKQVYTTSAAASIEIIRNACRSYNELALRKAAHKLMGACLSLGAVAMVRLLRQLEQAAATTIWDVAASLLPQIERENQRVPVGLDAFCQSLAAA